MAGPPRSPFDHVFFFLGLPSNHHSVEARSIQPTDFLCIIKYIWTFRAIALVCAKFKKKKNEKRFTRFCSKITHINGSITLYVYNIVIVTMHIYTVTVTFYLISLIYIFSLISHPCQTTFLPLHSLDFFNVQKKEKNRKKNKKEDKEDHCNQPTTHPTTTTQNKTKQKT